MAETEKRLTNIPGIGEDSWAVIKKFTFAEQGRMMDELNMDVKGNNPRTMTKTIRVNIFEMRMRMILYGVKEASFIPKGCGMEEKRRIIEDLSPEAGQYLYERVDEFNGKVSDEGFQKK